MSKRLPIEERLAIFRSMAMYSRDSQNLYVLFRNKAERSLSKRSKYRHVYREIQQRLDEESLSMPKALEPFVEPEEHLFIEMAFRRENTSDMLTQLVFLIEQKSLLKKSLMSAATKPTMFFVAASIFAYIVIYTLVPQFGSFALDAGGLNGAADVIVSDINPVLQKVLPVFFAILSLMIVLSFVVLPSLPLNPIRRLMDAIFPHYRVYRDYMGSVVLLGIGISMESSISIKDYLLYLHDTSKGALRDWAKLLFDRVSDGRYNIEVAMDVNLFTFTDMELIYDYIGSGGDIAKNLSLIGRESVGRTIESIRVKVNTFFWVSMITVLGTLFAYFGIVLGGFLKSVLGNSMYL